MTPQDLKDWRKLHHLTQDQAGYLFGITRLAWRSREQGKTKVTPETLYAARYLSEHPEEIARRLADFIPTQ